MRFTNQFGSSQSNVFEKEKLFQGFLVSSDGYMNLQLANTEEFIDGAPTGNLGEVLVRCNNVLYIRCGNINRKACPE